MRIRFSLSRLSVLAFALPMAAFLSAGLFCESRAHGQGLGATPTKAFRVPAGFEVEMVHEVSLAEQGSWVAMCVDMKLGDGVRAANVLVDATTFTVFTDPVDVLKKK